MAQVIPGILAVADLDAIAGFRRIRRRPPSR
jgi:hypothetical protein